MGNTHSQVGPIPPPVGNALANYRGFANYKMGWITPNLFEEASWAESLDYTKCYKMKSVPHGIAVIISNNKFYKCPEDGSIDLGDREGTEADTERLMSTFKELKFNVLVYKDMTSYDMKKVLQVAAMQDHSAYDSIVVCILSHGGPNDVVYGCNGVSVRIKDLMSLFTSNKCPTLKSKPKMFFIQACRQPGTGEEHPYWGLDSPSITSSGNEQIPDAAPVENTTSYDWADFLVGHSTFPGCQSFRDPDPAKGSYYITKLVQSLIKYHTEHHLLDILLIVNNEVAAESDIQIPAPTFSLTKKVYLL